MSPSEPPRDDPAATQNDMVGQEIDARSGCGPKGPVSGESAQAEPFHSSEKGEPLVAGALGPPWSAPPTATHTETCGHETAFSCAWVAPVGATVGSVCQAASAADGVPARITAAARTNMAANSTLKPRGRQRRRPGLAPTGKGKPAAGVDAVVAVARAAFTTHPQKSISTATQSRERAASGMRRLNPTMFLTPFSLADCCQARGRRSVPDVTRACRDPMLSWILAHLCSSAPRPDIPESFGFRHARIR